MKPTNKNLRKFVEEFNCKFCRGIIVSGEKCFECSDSVHHEVESIKAALKKFKQ